MEGTTHEISAVLKNRTGFQEMPCLTSSVIESRHFPSDLETNPRRTTPGPHGVFLSFIIAILGLVLPKLRSGEPNADPQERGQTSYMPVDIKESFASILSTMAELMLRVRLNERILRALPDDRK
jgi:hypothetical protein